MPHRILHLSDTHVSRQGRDQHGVDAVASLERILTDVRHVRDLDLVLVTGDIADDGSAEGCRAVRERVGAFAADRGIPHIYTTGNHDDRSAFTAELGSGHLVAGRDCAEDLVPGPERAAVSHVNGLRVLTLDSLVPGSVHGLLSTRQLEWLAAVLTEPAPAGSVVAFHHPPIHTTASDVMASVGLQNAPELADAVVGTDVQAILCGHYHLQLSGTLRGVPVWATPGVVTRIDLTAPSHLTRAVLGAGATIVDLGGPFSPVFHTVQARDPGAGRQAYLVDARTGVGVEED